MTYRFREFELDTARQELKQAGVVVPTQKKVFELLLFLIEHRDRALTKDEIQEAVWPGTIVSETAITRAILKARRAINDDAQTQELIKTIHGHGYRFIEEVSEGEITETGGNENHQRHIQRRGDLLRVATAYGAIAWLTNQIASMIWEAFEFDKLPLQILLGVSVLGLPLALLITWWFRLTSEGLKRRDELRGSDQVITNWRKYAVVATMLVIAAVTSALWQLRGGETATPAQTTAAIAVLPMINATNDPQHDWTRLGVMSLLNHQLEQANIDTASSRAVIRMLGEDTSNLVIDNALLERFRAAQAVETLIVPTLRNANSGMTLSLQVFNTEGSSIVEKEGDLIPTELALLAVKTLVQQLKPGTIPVRFQNGTSKDPFVNELYARGLHQSLTGNLVEARDLFALAAKRDDSYFFAQYEYAITTRYLGDFDAATPLLLELYSNAVLQENPQQIVMLCNALGVLYDLKGDMDEAEKYYIHGIEVAADNQFGRHYGDLMVNYAIIEKNRGNLKEARDLLGRSIVAYRKQGPVSGAVYNTLANVSVAEGNLQEAEVNYQKSAAAYVAQEHQSGEAIALSNLSWLAQTRHDFPTSLDYLARSMAIREKIEDRVGILKSLARKGSIEFEMGKLDECEKTANQMLADAHSKNENALAATAYSLLAMTASERNQFDVAVEGLEKALDISISRQDLGGTLRTQNALGSILIKSGDLEEAQRLLEQTAAQATEANLAPAALRAQFHLAKLIRVRDGEQASENVFETLLEATRRTDDAPLETLISIEYAEVLMALGKLEQAEALLSLINAESNPDMLKVRAAIAAKSGDHKNAGSLMANAKHLARQRWTETDEAVYQRYLDVSPKPI